MKKLLSLLTAIVVTGACFFSPDVPGISETSVVRSVGVSRISENGLMLIKEFEGFLQYAKWDYKQWTIGYGTGVDKNAYPNGITEAEADRLLREVVVVYEGYVQNFLNSYGIEVNQNQYDALVSFTYNLGNVWKNTSEVTIRTYLINGISNYTDKQITDAFKLWCKAGGEVLPGLLRRREEEAKLFLKGTSVSVPVKNERWRIKSTTGVRLRKDSVTTSDIIGVIPYNTLVTVEEKTERDGFVWGRISYNGKNGWCVLDYAEHVSGSIETTVVPDGTGYQKWRIVSDDGVKLRYNYGTEHEVLGVVPYGAIITVYEQQSKDGYIWGRTDFEGKAGWCVLNYASLFDDSEELLDGIYVVELPSKTTYTAGELFDSSGMKVSALYSTGREEIVSEYGCNGNTTMPGISTITVEYRGKCFELSVVVTPFAGDINKNGTVDIQDSLSIKKHILADADEDFDAELGDMNSDDVINIFDSIRAKKEFLYNNR